MTLERSRTIQPVAAASSWWPGGVRPTGLLLSIPVEWSGLGQRRPGGRATIHKIQTIQVAPESHAGLGATYAGAPSSDLEMFICEDNKREVRFT